jgi:hypothetical protein
MEQQAIENADRLTSEEANEPASLQIADLNLADAKAKEIKGGPLCHGTTVLAWARVDGVSASNHNETASYDETDLDELEDLLLTTAQESDIKAGWPISTWPPPGGTFNHNETVAADEATETEPIADLPVEEAEQIKGGLTSSSPSGTGKVLTAALLGKSN